MFEVSITIYYKTLSKDLCFSCAVKELIKDPTLLINSDITKDSHVSCDCCQAEIPETILGV